MGPLAARSCFRQSALGTGTTGLTSIESMRMLARLGTTACMPPSMRLSTASVNWATKFGSTVKYTMYSSGSYSFEFQRVRSTASTSVAAIAASVSPC